MEGVWGREKVFVRKHSDQTFNKLIQLMLQSRQNFERKKTFTNLFRHFWKAMQSYDQGQTYSQFLQLFFSNHCIGTVVSDRKITNSNLNDN